MKDFSYSIEEILVAVNELQNSNNPKKKKLDKIKNVSNITEIPKNTLRLIEEAEKIND
tara:strand:+ start:1177 stop:1350 length:174 start_codon:yes stop_codon:yes gene_type:complete